MRKLAIMRALGVPLGFVMAHALRLSSARVGLATMYHRVDDPPGDPGRELVPNLGTRLFAAQLRYMKACYRVVPASDLLAAARTRRRGQRIPLAITFDDDLACHLTRSAPLLQRAGLTATFFLCGASLSEPFAFWWEPLQAAVDRGVAVVGLPSNVAPGAIHELAENVKQLKPAERDALAARLAEAVGPPAADAGLRATQVQALADAGFEIGFHTRRHDFLPVLEDGALAAAMSDGRSELESVAGRRLRAFAYPHGGAGSRVAQAARDAGFECAFTTEGEAVAPDTDPLSIGRFEAPFESTGRLALRLSRGLWELRRSGRAAQRRR